MKYLWRDEYIPDVIIGAGRAGSIIAGIISGNLRKHKIPLYCIDFAYKWEEENRKTILHINPLLISNKKVLLVVGEVHTGNTLRNIVDVLKSENPKSIKTSTLFHSGVESFKPNYYAYTIVGKQKMPWHLNKDYEKNSFPDI